MNPCLASNFIDNWHPVQLEARYAYNRPFACNIHIASKQIQANSLSFYNKKTDYLSLKSIKSRTT